MKEKTAILRAFTENGKVKLTKRILIFLRRRKTEHKWFRVVRIDLRWGSNEKTQYTAIILENNLNKFKVYRKNW